MTQRFADKLTFGRKLLLATVGAAAIVLPVAFGLLNTVPGRAQSQAQALPAPRSTKSPPSGRTNPPTSVSRLWQRRATDLRQTLPWCRSFDSRMGSRTIRFPERQSGLAPTSTRLKPRWTVQREAVGKLGDDKEQPVRERMLQALLADRFKLTIHRETKELPIYSLVVAKGGPKLQEAKPERIRQRNQRSGRHPGRALC